MENDFKLFPSGDRTEIGERGITVSGGQKARLSLARAVYSKADIYLLDDPISAVDAKVARRMYHDVLRGVLKGKTVLLVTHQVHYLTECDHLIIMKDGGIEHQGTPLQLSGPLNKLMISEDSKGLSQIQGSHRTKMEAPPLEMLLQVDKASMRMEDEAPPESDGKLLSNEKEEPINVTFGTYIRYLLYHRKSYLLPLLLILYFLAEAANTSFFRILGLFDQVNSGLLTGWTIRDFWLILGFLALGYFVFLFCKCFATNYLVLKSNQVLHKNMLFGLLRTPVKYFDVTPSGRLINRFSNDISILDNVLASTLTDTIEGPVLALIMLVNIFQLVPYFIIPTAANMVLLGLWFAYCKSTIVQTKQLDLRMKSPVFS